MIDKIMKLSTAHVSKSTADWLDAQGLKNADWTIEDMGSIHVGSHAYGWFGYCHDEFGEDYPPSIIAVMEFARSRGCKWYNLDADADTYDELPVYDWEENDETGSFGRDSLASDV